MNNLELIKEFPISIFENLREISPTLSLRRVRIFYKGLNRNGTYITEEFAKDLIETLPYAPIKGIYDEEEKDFKDHGDKRQQGRIYGVVPKDMNFAWEKHLDEDGVEREYACADVLLYTGLYEEAKEITGKGHSMELHQPSIEGELITIEGQRVFRFTKGAFLGLQALGDTVEPCFEGSAFYALYEGFIKELTDYIRKENLAIDSQEIKQEGGNIQMPDMVYRLSDEKKSQKIFQALNTDGSFRFYPIETYDKEVIVIDFDSDKYFKVGYEKTEADEVVVSETKTEVFVEYTTESEKNALEALRAINGGSFEAIDTNYNTLQEEKVRLEGEVGELSQKKEEDASTISTLEAEKDTLTNTVATLTTEKETVETEINSLKEYKAEIETTQKLEVIARYSAQLSKEDIESFTEESDKYSVIDLEKEIAYKLAKDKPELFTINGGDPQGLIPNGEEEPVSGAERLINKHKKK